MKHFSARIGYMTTVALCCLLAVGLVLACTVYSAHAIEGETHCDCPICRLVSVVGGVFVLAAALAVLCVVRKAPRKEVQARAKEETPVLLAVKLNC